MKIARLFRIRNFAIALLVMILLMGFVALAVSRTNSETIAAGTVIGTDPANLKKATQMAAFRRVMRVNWHCA